MEHAARNLLRNIKFNQINKPNMETKSFLASKINWAAIVVILIAIKDAVANLDISLMTVQTWLTFGIGILIIVFRTYFTNTAIK